MALKYIYYFCDGSRRNPIFLICMNCNLKRKVDELKTGVSWFKKKRIVLYFFFYNLWFWAACANLILCNNSKNLMFDYTTSAMHTWTGILIKNHTTYQTISKYSLSSKISFRSTSNPKCQSGISSKIIKFLDPHKQKDMKNGQARIGYWEVWGGNTKYSVNLLRV